MFTLCNSFCDLQNTAETLRRQVKEEVHTRTVLQARINSDSSEIEKTRSESGKKKEKVMARLLTLLCGCLVVLTLMGTFRGLSTRMVYLKHDI